MYDCSVDGRPSVVTHQRTNDLYRAEEKEGVYMLKIGDFSKVKPGDCESAAPITMNWACSSLYRLMSSLAIVIIRPVN